MSQRLQQIERGLDVHLLDRSSRKLRFTEEGELLCRQGVGVIQKFDRLPEEVRARRGGMVGTGERQLSWPVDDNYLGRFVT